MELAVALGVDPQTVGRWERNQTTVHPGYLVQLAGHYNVPPATFGLDDYTGENVSAVHEEIADLREQLNQRMQHIEGLLSQLTLEIMRITK